jgi:transposase-like protein
MKKEYPESIQEFSLKFKEEQDCYDYLIAIKFPDGWKCASCKNDKYWKYSNPNIVRCTNCKLTYRVTAGTHFNNRHLSLKTWLYALWFMVSQKSGISALGLGREIGIRRQKTTWKLLALIRMSMTQVGKDKLEGTVEIDEVFIGGVQKGPPGRGAIGKELVLVAVEDKGEKGYGRIRMQTIEDATSATLLKAIQTMVKTDSTIRTDEFRSYEMLSKHNYKHIKVQRSSAVGEDPTPLVHRIASLLKRWLLGTHQGGIHLENLQSYLDEYVFRFNRRTSYSRGKLFYRLVQAMLGVK